MLTESEAVEAYTVLTHAAVEANLKWVVVDAEQQIALGIEETQVLKPEIKTRRDREDSAGSPSGKFVVSRLLSSAERLYMMIDALQAATSGLSAAAVDTVEYLESVDERYTRMAFAFDSEFEDAREIRRDQLPTREAIDRLDDLLHELKEEL